MADIDFSKYGITPASKDIDFKSYGIIPASGKMDSESHNGGLFDSESLPQSFKNGPIGDFLNDNNRNRIPHSAGVLAKDLYQLPAKLWKGGVRAITGIPKETEYLKENVPNSWNLAKSNPLSAIRSGIAGGTELLGQISNIPVSGAKYLEHLGLMDPEQFESMAKPFNNQEVSQFANRIEGEEHPGGALIRGAIRNIPSIYAGLKLASLVNPLKLTHGAIVKDVLKAKKAIQAKYSGPQGLYTNLFQDARNNGLGNFQHINTNNLNIPVLNKYTPRKSMESIKLFEQNPTLESGQEAVSQLGHIIRPLENKKSLPPWQKKQLEAAQDARDYIQKHMFMDNNGVLNNDFVKRHQVIQHGYATENIPYSTNQAIKKYEAGKMKKEELVEKLSKGEFAAQKGSAHPNIARRKTLNSFAHYLGEKSGTGAAFALINKLLGGG